MSEYSSIFVAPVGGVLRSMVRLCWWFVGQNMQQLLSVPSREATLINELLEGKCYYKIAVVIDNPYGPDLDISKCRIAHFQIYRKRTFFSSLRCWVE
jgi:hypothetical protein